jgi:hypothetical protein
LQPGDQAKGRRLNSFGTSSGCRMGPPVIPNPNVVSLNQRSHGTRMSSVPKRAARCRRALSGNGSGGEENPPRLSGLKWMDRANDVDRIEGWRREERSGMTSRPGRAPAGRFYYAHPASRCQLLKSFSAQCLTTRGCRSCSASPGHRTASKCIQSLRPW